MAALNVQSSGGSEEDQVTSAINTTPLVDIMLVLLIIFLVTIPVIVKTVPLRASQCAQYRDCHQAGKHCRFRRQE